MGRRGPKPTPTAILRLTGSRPDRTERKRVREPQPESAERPRPPTWLSKERPTDMNGAELDLPTPRQVWDRLAPQLHEIGVLTKVDVNALGRYCTLLVRWLEAEEIISERGKVYAVRHDDGRLKMMKRNPYVSIANETAAMLARLEAEFGMTPSSRASIKVDDGGKGGANPKQRYMTENAG